MIRMRKALQIGLVGLACVTGCQGVIGPFRSRTPTRVDDPHLTIQEQMRLGRDRYALPQQSPSLVPNDGGRPGISAFR